MHKRSILARGVSATLLALTACHDLPTPVSPDIPAPGASASLNQGQHTGQEPFYCTVREYAPSAPNGWETRRMTVFIPRGELHDGGRTVRYAYTRVFPTGRVFSFTHCDVPYTEGALRRVDRVMGVEKNGGADQFRARQRMITTQGCVTDVCPLEPIVITAPVKPTKEAGDVCERYPDECGSGGGGGDTDGGGDGGGWDPATDGDGPPEDAYSQEPGVFAACVGGLLATAASASMLQPVATDLYEKAGAVDAAGRMLHVVQANGASLETIARHEDALASARQAYKDAITNVALVAGATTLAVVASVVVCSPTLLLPTI